MNADEKTANEIFYQELKGYMQNCEELSKKKSILYFLM
jgi:hypothetical protein